MCLPCCSFKQTSHGQSLLPASTLNADLPETCFTPASDRNMPRCHNMDHPSVDSDQHNQDPATETLLHFTTTTVPKLPYTFLL